MIHNRKCQKQNRTNKNKQNDFFFPISESLCFIASNLLAIMTKELFSLEASAQDWAQPLILQTCLA